jgi:hypothetical protein
MRKEARLFKNKAVDALVLAIETFNRPYDRGGADSVVRDLSHAFEMLMKAAIVERGGRIRESRATQTIGLPAPCGPSPRLRRPSRRHRGSAQPVPDSQDR